MATLKDVLAPKLFGGKLKLRSQVEPVEPEVPVEPQVEEPSEEGTDLEAVAE